MKTTVIQITVRHSRDLPDLPAIVAQRTWNIDGVEHVEEPQVLILAAVPKPVATPICASTPVPLFAKATDYWSSLDQQAHDVDSRIAASRWLNPK